MANLQSSTVNGFTAWHRGNYPELIAQYNLSGSYAANTWHQVGNWRIDNGTVCLLAYGDTYSAAGQLYFGNMTFSVGSVFPINTVTTNSTYEENFGSMIFAGHAPNSEVWQARIRHLGGNPAVSPILEFQTNFNLSGIDGTAGRTGYFQIWKVAGPSL